MTSCPAMILAGGRGMRLGQRDKALCVLGGASLLQHCCTRLSTQCDPLALNANGDLERFSDFDIPVIADSTGDHFGPLAGVLAAMDWAAELGHGDVVTVAVDTPFFPHDLVAKLQAQRAPNTIALAATRDAEGRLWRHPTFGLWPTHLRDDLRAALSSGTRKVTEWADRQGATYVTFKTTPNDPFFNINTPEDLEQAEKLIRV